jgi:hypothetical protein
LKPYVSAGAAPELAQPAEAVLGLHLPGLPAVRAGDDLGVQRRPAQRLDGGDEALGVGEILGVVRAAAEEERDPLRGGEVSWGLLAAAASPKRSAGAVNTPE